MDMTGMGRFVQVENVFYRVLRNYVLAEYFKVLAYCTF